MTKQYTITLTDAEEKAMSVYALDVNEWIQYMVHDRCRVAIDEIAKAEIERKLDAGEAITGSKEDIVLQAVVETAVEKSIRIQEEIKRLEEQQG